ncbi:zinc finger protein 420-like [Corythoichthys intestinalis]|uniref:zinc finger protein 420-like n=1 Tax=Corythoichthys intestinalis TaxID=161448 RepID=UPI0025A5C445|nr:zinc finger protein 420-like [Corythoichthys intestinalis]XP_057700392.1 zinc finger protein 420-like [Corythoichthys intestinalis]XP_057700393.1 zinc finger protein 420-like [Corythoichthys intestinalis]XP_057700394.1 zinc finger protein 420-like [Corythoichthys intestinalis]
MGDVTLVVDEMVRQVLLPEPQLVILALPPPFLPTVSEPTIVWPKWLNGFKRYLEALGKEKLTDKSKCMLLQNCLGLEGQRIFAALIQQDQSYATVISTLTAYFTAGRTTRQRLLRFHERDQKAGETTAEFVAALEELLPPGNNGSDEKILNQLIEKTKWPQLRKRLCSKRATLTLAAALRIAKDVESTTLNRPQDHNHPGLQRRKRGRPRRAEKVKIETQRTGLKANHSHSEHKLEEEQQQKQQEDEQQPQEDQEEEEQQQEEGQEENEPQEEEEEQQQDDDDKNDPNYEVDDDDDDDENYNYKANAKSSPPNSIQRDVQDKLGMNGNTQTPTCFSCPMCEYKNLSLHKLTRHLRVHTKEKPFCCPICATVFSQSYHLTRHMRVQHNAAQHVCPTCCSSFRSVAELKSHKATHAPHVLLCPYCPEKSPNNSTFLLHIASHKEYNPLGAEMNQGREVKTNMLESLIKENICSVGDGVTDESMVSDVRTETESASIDGRSGASVPCKKTHVCSICNQSFPGVNKLTRHMRTHTKEKPFQCTVCLLNFSQSYHMTRHQRQKHGMQTFICKCGKKFASWLKLKVHRKTHKILTCPSCKMSFKDKDDLENHLKSHAKIPRTPLSLICDECGKVFGRRYHLKRHMVMHYKAANTGYFTCAECKADFALAEDLKKHLKRHAKENSGTCLRCNQNFPSQEELKAHMAAHNITYLCSVCGKKFKLASALKKHEEKHKDQQYYCAMCCKHFRSHLEYKRHKAVHDRRENKCPHCERVFLKLTTFKYHLQTHTEERPYQCMYCMETFVYNEEMERHCLKHRKFRKEHPYNCTRCNDAFATLAELTAHLDSHKGESPLSCDICARTFLNASKLEKHLSVHTGERPHLCPHCGNGFPTAANLRQHILSHTGEKPFACSECTKTFRTAGGLRVHRRRHMDVPPSFECLECGRTYGRVTELRMHQRYHTGDKPFSCISCNKNFISKHKLMVHTRIHTGERPYSCPHCQQTFRQTGDRNRHVNKFHPNASELTSTKG